jgi:hypothetical protein
VSVGVDILKKVEGDLGVPVSMVRSEVLASGLEIFQYEPRGPVKIGDANLVSGMLTRHPDGTVQFLGFCVNDAALADLPGPRRLIAEMVASLTPGARPLPSGARVQLAGNLVLDLLPGYTAYRQEGPDFDVYWIQHLVPMGQPAGRLGLYSGHHPQPPAHPPAGLLEAQGGMPRLLLEAFERLVSEPLDLPGQAPIRSPELRRGVMGQRGVVLRAEWSRRAASASRSSLPACTSAASCRSQADQSNSRNQARSWASSSGANDSISCSIFSTLPMRKV